MTRRESPALPLLLNPITHLQSISQRGRLAITIDQRLKLINYTSTRKQNAGPKRHRHASWIFLCILYQTLDLCAHISLDRTPKGRRKLRGIMNCPEKSAYVLFKSWNLHYFRVFCISWLLASFPICLSYSFSVSGHPEFPLMDPIKEVFPPGILGQHRWASPHLCLSSDSPSIFRALTQHVPLRR